MHKLSKTIAVLAVASVAGVAVANTIVLPPPNAAKAHMASASSIQAYYVNTGKTVFTPTKAKALGGLASKITSSPFIQTKYSQLPIRTTSQNQFIYYYSTQSNYPFCAIILSGQSGYLPSINAVTLTSPDPYGPGVTCKVGYLTGASTPSTSTVVLSISVNS